MQYASEVSFHIVLDRSRATPYINKVSCFTAVEPHVTSGRGETWSEILVLLVQTLLQWRRALLRKIPPKELRRTSRSAQEGGDTAISPQVAPLFISRQGLGQGVLTPVARYADPRFLRQGYIRTVAANASALVPFLTLISSQQSYSNQILSSLQYNSHTTISSMSLDMNIPKVRSGSFQQNFATRLARS